MNQEEYVALVGQGYNHIPVVREVLADLDTPLSTYFKLANSPHSYLFESVHGGEKWGRYSIIGLPANSRIEVHGHEIRFIENGKIIDSTVVDDPLAWIEDFQQQYRAPELPGMPRFLGGLVGYFGYDTIRYIEPRLGECPNPDPIGVPDILLMISNEVVVFDNLKGKLYLVVHVDPTIADAYQQAQTRIDGLVEKLRQPVSVPVPTVRNKVSESDFVSGFTQEGFETAVERSREYIIEGDVMQVVLSQRLSIPFKSQPIDLYRALRSLNPSPYMYHLNFGDFFVVGSSPEILVHLEEGMVTVRPIAGTRPRGKTEEEEQTGHEQCRMMGVKYGPEHKKYVDSNDPERHRVITGVPEGITEFRPLVLGKQAGKVLT